MGPGYSHLVHAQEPAACFGIAGIAVPAAYRHSHLSWVRLRPGERLVESVWVARPGLLPHLRAGNADRPGRRGVSSNDLRRAALRDAADDHFLQFCRRCFSRAAGFDRPGSIDAGTAEYAVECIYERGGHSRILCVRMDVVRLVAAAGLPACARFDGNARRIRILEAGLGFRTRL